MHVIKQRTPRHNGSQTLFVEIAGQVQGLPPLLVAEPGQWLAVLTDAEAFQLRLSRQMAEIDSKLKGE